MPENIEHFKSSSINGLWLYDVYRGMAEVGHADVSGVIHALNIFKNKSTYNPINTERTITLYKDRKDGPYKVLWSTSRYDDFIIPLYKEGVMLGRVMGNELANIMGDDLANDLKNSGIPIDDYKGKYGDSVFSSSSPSQEKFEEKCGLSFVYNAFETVRYQSLLVFLHDSNAITEDQFHKALSVIKAHMDKTGLNGINSLIDANPDILNYFKNDARPIVIRSDSGLASIEAEIYTGQKMARGEYFKRMYAVDSSPFAVKKLIKKMLGNDYPEANSERERIFNDYKGKCSNLNVPLPDLLKTMFDVPEEKPIMQQTHEDILFEENYRRAHKTFYINYGLGAQHEKLEEMYKDMAARKGQNPENVKLLETAHRFANSEFENSNEIPPKVDIKKKTPAEQNYWATKLDGKQAGSSTGSKLTDQKIKNPATEHETNKGNQPHPDTKSTEEKTSTSKESTQPDPNAKTSEEYKEPPLATEPKHKNFVTAGKIATTAVLSIGIVDGVKNLMKKDDSNNPEKSKSSSKTFLRALEIAAAVAGIVLVWKSKKAHNFLNNLFKSNAQSVK